MYENFDKKSVPNFRAQASSYDWRRRRMKLYGAQLQTMVYLSWKFHCHIFDSFWGEAGTKWALKIYKISDKSRPEVTSSK